MPAAYIEMLVSACGGRRRWIRWTMAPAAKPKKVAARKIQNGMPSVGVALLRFVEMLTEVA